jgi:SAM-dependent methyltransferase
MSWVEEFFDDVYLDFMQYYRNEEVSKVEAAFIQRSLGVRAGARFLDVACGHGRHMAHMPRDSVVGIDIKLEIGRASCRERV